MEFKVGKTGQLKVIDGKPALIVIDMQDDWLSPPFMPRGSSEVASLVSNVRKLLEAARSARVPVIHTKEWHRSGKLDMGSERYPGTGLGIPDGTDDASVPVHCVEGSKGAEIIEELAPIPGEYVITKRRFSAFLGTELDILLRDLNVETLIVSGVMSEVCVLFTAGEAHQRDYHVRVVEGCTLGSTKELTRAAIEVIRALTTGIPITLDITLRSLEEYKGLALQRP
jgi:nicotinamidase-related amidase